MAIWKLFTKSKIRIFKKVLLLIMYFKASKMSYICHSLSLMSHKGLNLCSEKS